MATIRPPETFTTERLRLRRPVPGDAEQMFERWAKDPEVTKHLVWRPHADVSESRAHIERCMSAWEDGSEFVWFIESKESVRLVGSLAARRGGIRVNVGYLITRDCWGRGYMTEALEAVVSWWLDQPGIFRVWATTDLENPASARVLEKAGFSREGILRSWQLHPNVSSEPRDALCFSRTKAAPGEEEG